MMDNIEIFPVVCLYMRKIRHDLKFKANKTEPFFILKA